MHFEAQISGIKKMQGLALFKCLTSFKFSAAFLEPCHAREMLLQRRQRNGQASQASAFTFKYKVAQWNGKKALYVYLFFYAKGKRALSLDRLPPKTPDKCDPTLSFDAVTGMQQELVFFKNR